MSDILRIERSKENTFSGSKLRGKYPNGLSVCSQCVLTVLLSTFLLQRKVQLFIPLNSDELAADLKDVKPCVKIKTIENWHILYVRMQTLRTLSYQLWQALLGLRLKSFRVS